MLLGGAIAAVAVAQPDTDTRREQAQQQLDSIQETLTTLAAERQQRNQQLDMLVSAERQRALAIRATETELEMTATDITDNQLQLDELQSRALEQQQELDQQQGKLAEQLINTYRNGHRSRLKLLLNQQDPQLANRTLAYHNYFNQQRAEVITGVQQQLEQLQQTRQLIADRQQQLQSLQQQQTDSLSNLQTQQQAQAKVRQQINTELQDIEARITELKLNQQQLRLLLEELQDLFGDIPDDLDEQQFRDLRGQLPWPVQQSSRKLLASYGSRRARDVKWDGIFIASPAETPVLAVARGRVVFADWLRGFGWMVIVDHGDEYMSLYGNNSRLLQDVGSWVQPGETLAVTADGFGAEQLSGLYFELRRAGDTYNPQSWLSQ